MKTEPAPPSPETLEPSLRETLRVLEAILAATPDFAYAFDRNARFVYANRRLLEVWGRTRDEAVGKGLRELGYPEWHAAMHEREIAEVIATKRSILGEVPFTGASGISGVYEYIFSPVLGPDGEVELIAGTTREVSARRQFESAQRMAEQRARNILESIDDAYFGFDHEWRFTYVNRRAQEMLGTGPAEMLGRALWEFYPGLVGSVFEPIIRRTLDAGTAGAVTAYYPDHARWYQVRTFPAGDGISIYFRDVSEEKAAEEALRIGEERLGRARLILSGVIESAEELIAAVDTELRYVAVNQASRTYFQEVFGATIEVGMGVHETLAHRPDVAEATSALWWTALGGENVRRTLKVGPPDARRAYDVRIYPLRDAEGRIMGATGLARDVTDRVRTEAILRENDEMLRRADRAKDEFLAVLAHELRNPLAPLRNALHVLRMSERPEAPQPLFAMMQRQVDHLVRLVDDLLEVSRITRGQIELRRTVVDVAEVVRTAVDTSRPWIDANHHRLHVEVPDEPVVVDADPVRLAQILSNLLNNAAKYTPEGGDVWLTVSSDGAETRLSVRDSGIGIAADKLPLVFDLFAQVDPGARPAQGGLGIGLSLVRSLVRMHGGSVEARSEGPRRGSEFLVRLPSVTGARLAASELGGATPLRPKRVLVVDDNRDAAESLAMLLQLLGSEARQAFDGESALALAASMRPAVVLLDIGMPGMDGYEVARRLRADEATRAATLIALTGWGHEEDRRRVLAAGFDHHLVKPVDVDALQRLLDSLAEGAPAADERGYSGSSSSPG